MNNLLNNHLNTKKLFTNIYILMVDIKYLIKCFFN